MQEEFSCKLCQLSFNSALGINHHYRKTHKLTGKEEVYNLIYNITERPKCKCGCGGYPALAAGKGIGYREYIRGHQARVNNNYGHNKAALVKSVETRRKRFKDGSIVQWNKGIKLEGDRLLAAQEVAKNPKRCKKISDALKGRPKSEEHKKKTSEVLARNRQLILKGNPSKLEYVFGDILISLSIKYIHQYQIESFTYDFYLPDHNILIEVDGDYWHCNEARGYMPKTKIHTTVIKNDKIKNKLAFTYGHKLLRFWEYDIKNNRIDVVKRILENIN